MLPYPAQVVSGLLAGDGKFPQERLAFPGLIRFQENEPVLQVENSSTDAHIEGLRLRMRRTACECSAAPGARGRGRRASRASWTGRSWRPSAGVIRAAASRPQDQARPGQGGPVRRSGCVRARIRWESACENCAIVIARLLSVRLARERATVTSSSAYSSGGMPLATAHSSQASSLSRRRRRKSHQTQG